MNAAPIAPSAQGWQAQLQLKFQRRQARTALTHRAHRGPLLVQRAFYPEGSSGTESFCAEPCHVYVIHPPGGLVSGDELALEVDVQTQAHALLTTPAAGKFYRRRGASVARLTQTLRIDSGVLEWLPQENIYYPEAAVELRTIVTLTGAARFIGWELGCLGLPANQCTIGGGRVRQCFELWRDDAPVLLEHLNLDERCLESRWGAAGYPVLGTWIASPAHAIHLERARAAAEHAQANCADLTLACTLVDGALCCRGYAARADRLKQSFIDMWSALRLELVGRPAMPPRIWVT
jgi:urease accessory protein